MEELVGPLQDVMKDLKLKWKEFQEAEPFLDVVKGFVAAIDWKAGAGGARHTAWWCLW